MKLTNIIAAENFMTVLTEGRMIRNAFNRTDKNGRLLACAYAAAVSGATDTKDCPAEVMPQWVADLTPWLDDAGTPPDGTDTCTWHKNMVRYGTAMGQWHVLGVDDWARISRRFRAACCVSALASAAKVVPAGAPYWPAIVAAATEISECLLRDEEPTLEMKAAAAAARGAAAAAARGAEAAEAEAAADTLIDQFLTLVEDVIEHRA